MRHEACLQHATEIIEDQREVGGPEPHARRQPGLGFRAWHPLLHQVSDHADQPCKTHVAREQVKVSLGP